MVLPHININRHRRTRVPLPEPPSHLPPGHPSAPAPRILYQTWTGNCFLYDIIHVFMTFPQIIPPSPSPTESKRLFCNLCLFQFWFPWCVFLALVLLGHMNTLSLTKEARIYNGGKTISLTFGAGKTGQPLVKE